LIMLSMVKRKNASSSRAGVMTTYFVADGFMALKCEDCDLVSADAVRC
jgi:hypothetical protein